MARPYFVPLDCEMVKQIMTRDFNHFTDRGLYFNEKDDPLCEYALGHKTRLTTDRQ